MEPLPPDDQNRDYEVADFPFCVAWRTCRTKAGQRQGLAYAEGFASIEGIPVPKVHAWCVTSGGMVLDPSWSHGHHYFGFIIQQQFAEPFMSEIDYGLMGMHSASPLLSSPIETWMVPHPALQERKAS